MRESWRRVSTIESSCEMAVESARSARGCSIFQMPSFLLSSMLVSEFLMLIALTLDCSISTTLAVVSASSRVVFWLRSTNQM